MWLLSIPPPSCLHSALWLPWSRCRTLTWPCWTSRGLPKPPLKPVNDYLDGIPFVQQVNCITLFSIICKLARSALNPTVSVTGTMLNSAYPKTNLWGISIISSIHLGIEPIDCNSFNCFVVRLDYIGFCGKNSSTMVGTGDISNWNDYQYQYIKKKETHSAQGPAHTPSSLCFANISIHQIFQNKEKKIHLTNMT